jgi:hypothetical protein
MIASFTMLAKNNKRKKKKEKEDISLAILRPCLQYSIKKKKGISRLVSMLLLLVHNAR